MKIVNQIFKNDYITVKAIATEPKFGTTYVTFQYVAIRKAIRGTMMSKLISTGATFSISLENVKRSFKLVKKDKAA